MQKYNDSADIYYNILSGGIQRGGGHPAPSSVFFGSPMLSRRQQHGRGVNLLSFIAKIAPRLARSLMSGVKAAKAVAPGLKGAAIRLAKNTGKEVVKSAGKAALTEGGRLLDRFANEYNRNESGNLSPSKRRKKLPRINALDTGDEAGPSPLAPITAFPSNDSTAQTKRKSRGKKRKRGGKTSGAPRDIFSK